MRTSLSRLAAVFALFASFTVSFVANAQESKSLMEWTQFASTSGSTPVLKSGSDLVFRLNGGTAALQATLQNGVTSGNIAVSLSGMPAGVYTVSAVTESSGSTVVLGTVTVSPGLLPILSGSSYTTGNGQTQGATGAELSTIIIGEAGTLILSGSNTFSGATVVSAGTLNVAGAVTIQTHIGTPVLNSGGAIFLAGGTGISSGSSTYTTVTLNLSGSSLILAPPANYSGATLTAGQTISGVADQPRILETPIVNARRSHLKGKNLFINGPGAGQSTVTTVAPWTISRGYADFGSNGVPFPDGFDPFDVATVLLSDSNGSLVSTATLTPVPNGFYTALSPLVAGTAAPAASGFALVRADSLPHPSHITPLADLGIPLAPNSLSGLAVPLPPPTVWRNNNRLIIRAKGLPARTTLIYAADGTDLGKAKTDSAGDLKVDAAQPQKLPRSLDLFSIKTVTVHDASGNVLAGAEF